MPSRPRPYGCPTVTAPHFDHPGAHHSKRARARGPREAHPLEARLREVLLAPLLYEWLLHPERNRVHNFPEASVPVMVWLAAYIASVLPEEVEVGIVRKRQDGDFVSAAVVLGRDRPPIPLSSPWLTALAATSWDRRANRREMLGMLEALRRAGEGGSADGR